MAKDLTSLPLDSLRTKLKSAQATRRTVAAIFAAIVLAWIVLGFWRTHTPVFIITLAMGVSAVAAASTTTRALKAEIARRGSAQ